MKTTNGSATTPFISLGTSRRCLSNGLMYFGFSGFMISGYWASAYCLAPPLETYVSLTPTIFRASF